MEERKPSSSTLPASDNVPTGNLIDIPDDASHAETQKIEKVNPSKDIYVHVYKCTYPLPPPFFYKIFPY